MAVFVRSMYIIVFVMIYYKICAVWPKNLSKILALQKTKNGIQNKETCPLLLFNGQSIVPPYETRGFFMGALPDDVPTWVVPNTGLCLLANFKSLALFLLHMDKTRLKRIRTHSSSL